MAGTVPVKLPADRLGKLPRRVVVGIYLDDQLAVAHDQAGADLASARQRLEAEEGRRVAAGKADRPNEEASVIRAEVAAAIDAELAPLQAAVDRALVALDAATIWLTFRSLGRKRWHALLEEHPPTDADHEAFARETGNPEARSRWNAETLAPVLVRRACISRVVAGVEQGPLEQADVDAMWDGDAWNETELQALFITAVVAQSQGRAVQHRPAPAADALVATG